MMFTATASKVFANLKTAYALTEPFPENIPQSCAKLSRDYGGHSHGEYRAACLRTV
jgi:hypothetical protein